MGAESSALQRPATYTIRENSLPRYVSVSLWHRTYVTIKKDNTCQTISQSWAQGKHSLKVLFLTLSAAESRPGWGVGVLGPHWSAYFESDYHWSPSGGISTMLTLTFSPWSCGVLVCKLYGLQFSYLKKVSERFSRKCNHVRHSIQLILLIFPSQDEQCFQLLKNLTYSFFPPPLVELSQTDDLW